MNSVALSLADLALEILQLYTWVIIVAVIASWLVGFGIINSYNSIARAILRVLHALTEPVFRPVRRLIPPMGGLDLSPLVVLLLVYFLQRLILRSVYGF
jgi:YggT family protein